MSLRSTHGTGTDAMISRYTAEIGTATSDGRPGLAAVVGALEFGIGWGDAGRSLAHFSISGFSSSPPAQER